MPYREKTAWISLLSTLAVWGVYFLRMSGDLLAGRIGSDLHLGAFVASVVAIVVVQVVLQVAIAVRSPRDAAEPADERERMFELKASRVGYVLLGALVMTIAMCAPLVGLVAPALWRASPSPAIALGLLFGNALLLAAVIAEVVHSAVRIVHYRRDAMA
jgi:hypothetical protein